MFGGVLGYPGTFHWAMAPTIRDPSHPGSTDRLASKFLICYFDLSNPAHGHVMLVYPGVQVRHSLPVEYFSQIDSGAGGSDFGACTEGLGHPCAHSSDLGAVAGAKELLGCDDIFVPSPYDRTTSASAPR
jgi:hypothetical protein